MEQPKEASAVELLMAELVAVVQQEAQVFQDLLDSVGREQEALVHHEVGPIEAAIGEQSRLTAQAAVLEQERARIVEELSQVLGVDPSDLTLKKLIVRVGGPEAERLSEMRQTLIEAHERIQRANRHNAVLIRQSMKYVDRTLNILSGEETAPGVYAGSGKLARPKSSGQAVVDQVA